MSRERASGGRRVLVVDDHEDARLALRALLELWGHEVEEAADGRTGLDRMLARPPEVAIVDVGLPELDGYSVARAIRASPVGAAVFLVAVTGYGQSEHREAALDAGFDAHLVKPVSADDLMRVLERRGGSA